MNFRTRFAVALVTVSTLVPIAFGQYVGPSSGTSYRSVSEVLKKPIDDAPVILEGYIIRHVTKDRYMFSDGTGEIQVEIDRKTFPATAVSEKTKVRISGEIDKDVLRSPEIEVKNLVVVN